MPTPIGNIFQQGCEEIWNGEVAHEIRRTILDQSFRFCVRCPYLPGNRPAVNRVPSQEDVDTSRIHTLILNYDRTCNLTCPSCRKDVVARKIDDPEISRVHQALMESGVLAITNRLYVTGAGDPFASPTYWHLVTHLPDLPLLRLILHTNGILLDERRWEALGSARRRLVELNVSIDASTEETYRQNRGESWQVLWHNLDHVVKRRREEGLTFDLGAHFVIQANNMREIVPFIEMTLARGANWANFLFLRNWGSYDEDDYRQRAVHLPDHPDYAELVEIMARPIVYQNPRVYVPTFPIKPLPPLVQA